MKKLVLMVMSLFLVGMTVTLKSQNMTQDEKNGYAIGVSQGEQMFEQLKNVGIYIDFESVKKGLLDAFNGVNKFTPDEIQACFNNLQEQMQSKQNQEVGVEKEKGQQFLAENKKRKEVIETASGLQYEVIVMGKGEKPVATDKVKVHYTGKILDGQVFDSSVGRGEPATFVLNQVIAGWTEGLQLMPVGSKYMLYIPSELGYGERSQAGGIIKPGATLIFEVELLEIIK
jgi:FKBP-type peptidyl-prolyl cis-trans isomerase